MNILPSSDLCRHTPIGTPVARLAILQLDLADSTMFNRRSLKLYLAAAAPLATTPAHSRLINEVYYDHANVSADMFPKFNVYNFLPALAPPTSVAAPTEV